MFLSFAWACGGNGDGGGTGDAPPADAPAGAVDAPAATVFDGRPAVLFLGTSLTAGLGVDPARAFPAVIQRWMDSTGHDWQAVNAGVSGETSAGARRRFERLLDPTVRIVVLETGANDGLRGIEPESTRANLDGIVRGIRAYDSTIVIVLAGMEAPPNLGSRFTVPFRAIFADLAQRERLPFVPFLLEGVGGVDTLNQDDGIHPTPRGHELVARNVWRVLEGAVVECDRRRAAAGAGGRR